MMKGFKDRVRIRITPSHSKKNCRRLDESDSSSLFYFTLRLIDKTKIDYLGLKKFDVLNGLIFGTNPFCCLDELMKLMMTNATLVKFLSFVIWQCDPWTI